MGVVVRAGPGRTFIGSAMRKRGGVERINRHPLIADEGNMAARAVRGQIATSGKHTNVQLHRPLTRRRLRNEARDVGTPDIASSR